jgi:hypothetical protein
MLLLLPSSFLASERRYSNQTTKPTVMRTAEMKMLYAMMISLIFINGMIIKSLYPKNAGVYFRIYAVIIAVFLRKIT